ncbi:UPF0688 protein C1orf174 homolog [Electrophorus electricus]|uniref:Uncharacterized protein n=1 Tax=Electrophorus electricus TaxID=8005 RepID=A0A4W4DR01_ELEEL|nr:UPF0688 protein C1orf174 homolog [Electrophorus electricus]
MAGDRRKRKRLPKRPFHGERENSSEDLNETVGTQQALMTCADRNGGKVRRGKENSAMKSKALPHYNTPDLFGKVEDPADYGSTEQTDHIAFFDEDSNHIFPVEQFFGNLDSVQEYSGKATTERISRREYRRRHYYAKEDSDEEQI